MRHGLREPFDPVDAIVDHATHVTTQADAAIVYVQRAGRRGRSYHVVIEGADGIVTGMLNLARQELNNLGRNYGVDPYPCMDKRDTSQIKRLFLASLHEALTALSGAHGVSPV